jgi:hypothetical protein
MAWHGNTPLDLSGPLTSHPHLQDRIKICAQEFQNEFNKILYIQLNMGE